MKNDDDDDDVDDNVSAAAAKKWLLKRSICAREKPVSWSLQKD